jgi:orotate phosphoribosyltransferase
MSFYPSNTTDTIMAWEERKEKLGKEIIGLLYQKGLIKTWYRDKPDGWKLVSGLWSPFYIQLRPLSSFPELLRTVGAALGALIIEECKGVTKVVGLAMTGIPLACSVSLQKDIPALWTRRLDVRTPDEFKRYIHQYGEHTLLEGELKNGDRLAIIDDLATKFDSKLVARAQISYEAEKRGLTIECTDVVVLIDREQGAADVASKHGISLHSLIPFKSKGIEWLRSALSTNEYEVITDYLRDEKSFQNAAVQNELREICL